MQFCSKCKKNVVFEEGICSVCGWEKEAADKQFGHHLSNVQKKRMRRRRKKHLSEEDVRNVLRNSEDIFKSAQTIIYEILQENFHQLKSNVNPFVLFECGTFLFYHVDMYLNTKQDFREFCNFINACAIRDIGTQKDWSGHCGERKDKQIELRVIKYLEIGKKTEKVSFQQFSYFISLVQRAMDKCDVEEWWLQDDEIVPIYLSVITIYHVSRRVLNAIEGTLKLYDEIIEVLYCSDS